MIAEALVRRNLRVLITASTNVAVDGAILAAGSRLGADGRVVRLGPPQLAALRAEPMLQLEGVALSLSTEIHEKRLALSAERASLTGVPTVEAAPEAPPEQQTALFWNLPQSWQPFSGSAQTVRRRHRGQTGGDREQLKALQERERALMRELEGLKERALREARVVGATLAKIYLTPAIEARSFDAVLIDEASAASLPAVFFAATRAGKKAIALGDPRQLPPIAQARSQAAVRWLRRDVFHHVRLADDDSRAVLLREQYRMQPAISRLANELVYGGRLRDGVSSSGTEQCLRLVDTSAEDCVSERLPTGSRTNPLHAQWAVELAAELVGDELALPAGERPAAIITPYAAQAKLIWRLVREAGLDHLVDVGTVHRFQGLERDVVIFDTVEAPPFRPAPFVSGGYGSEAMRLINVAITRARLKLVVVANVHYLARTLPRNATLLALLRMMEDG
jgi:superfamily I DNA and/or RNA helicase